MLSKLIIMLMILPFRLLIDQVNASEIRLFQFNQEIRVNDILNSATNPDVSLSSDGNIVIVWKANGSPIHIYGQLFNKDLLRNGQNFILTEDQHSTYQILGAPRVVADSIGNFTLVHEHKVYNNFYGKTQYYPNLQKFDKYGQRLTNTGGFGVPASGTPTYPTVIMRKDGNPIISCAQSYGNYFKYRILCKFDIQSSDYIVVNNREESKPWDKEKKYPQVSVNQNGDFVIVWQEKEGVGSNNYDIVCQLFDMNGNPVNDNVVVNDTNINFNHSLPDIGIDTNGNFVVVWQDNRNGNWDIYCQRFNNIGEKIGENQKINDSIGGSKPCIDFDHDNRYLICWVDYRHTKPLIYSQLYDPNGKTLGNNHCVNDSISENVQNLNPKIEIQNGLAYYAWQKNSNIYLKVEDILTNIEQDRILEENLNLPKFFLLQNYPNPFNSETIISYFVPKINIVDLSLFNINGKFIETIISQKQVAGDYKIKFNAIDLPSGLYFLKLRIGNNVQRTKLLLAK